MKKISIISTLLIVLIVGIICFIVGAVIGYDLRDKKEEPNTLTVAAISEKIERSSDLISAKARFTGYVTYTEGKIPVITKKSATMIYTANITAGIDISKVKISVDDKLVKIDLPRSEIKNIEVDPSSIKFVDEKWAVLNPEKKEDVTEMLIAAEENAKNNADIDTLLQTATDSSVDIVKELIEPMLGNDQAIIVDIID